MFHQSAWWFTSFNITGRPVTLLWQHYNPTQHDCTGISYWLYILLVTQKRDRKWNYSNSTKTGLVWRQSILKLTFITGLLTQHSKLERKLQRYLCKCITATSDFSTSERESHLIPVLDWNIHTARTGSSWRSWFLNYLMKISQFQGP
jgi:hypothetical protein